MQCLLQLRQCVPCDPEYLARINIEILVGHHITKAHDALPVLLWNLILQGIARELVELFDSLTESQVLHAYGIQKEPSCLCALQISLCLNWGHSLLQ